MTHRIKKKIFCLIDENQSPVSGAIDSFIINFIAKRVDVKQLIDGRMCHSSNGQITPSNRFSSGHRPSSPIKTQRRLENKIVIEQILQKKSISSLPINHFFL